MGNMFRVRIYSVHAIVGKTELVKPLSKLGARLLEMSKEEPPVKAEKAKKTRKARTKKAVAPVNADALSGVDEA